MKISRYNVFIPYNNVLFIYNTLWNTVLVIKKDKAKDWGIDSVKNVKYYLFVLEGVHNKDWRTRIKIHVQCREPRRIK